MRESNKAQIYHYFGSKEGLFDAVFAQIVDQVVHEVPLDVTDLPGYAEQLARGYDLHPDVMRLATWHSLERGDELLVQAAIDSNQAKVDKIAQAQAEGRLPNQYPAATLLALVLHTAALWAGMPPELAAIAFLQDADSRANAVRDAVRALLDP